MLKYDISKHRYRRKLPIKKAIFKFGVVVFIFAAIVGFFYLPKFRLKNIIVQGDSFEGAEAKIELSLREKIFGILPSDNFFLFSKKSAAEKILKNFPEIKAVNFDREFPNTLIVNFEPRKKIALWCFSDIPRREPTILLQDAGNQVSDAGSEICYFIDNGGVAFEKSFWAENKIETKTVLKFTTEESGENYNNFELGNSVMEKEKLRSFLEFVKNAGDFFNLETEKIIIKGNSYRIYFKKVGGETSPTGWFVLLDKETDFKKAFENLKLVLENQVKEKRADLEYIDLRFSNKVFFKRL